jgi:hypothetical protein
MLDIGWRNILYFEPIRYTLGVLIAIGIVGVVFSIRTRGTAERVRFLAHVGKWAGYVVAIGLALMYVARIVIQLLGRTVPIRLSYSRFWPDLPTNVSATAGTATIEPNNSGFTDALLQVQGLSPVARILQSTETLAEAAVLISIALVIAQLSASLLGAQTFGGVRWKLLSVAALVIFSAGLIWIFIDIPTQMIAFQEVSYRFVEFDTDQWTCVMDGSHACGIVYVDLTSFAPTWPLLVAIVMVVGSFILRRGNELEDDNRGLI